jgi:hypothetical protein
MIGKLGEKYIVSGISAIRVSEGIAEVDNERGERRFGLFASCSAALSQAGFFRPYGAGSFCAPCPRAYALGYSLPSIREGCGDCDVRAIPP